MTLEAAPTTLRTIHRATLVVIALLAGLSALQPRATEEPAPDPTLTAVALALAVAIIVLRRAASSALISASTQLTIILCISATAAALAGLGSYLAMDMGQARTGLAFALAAGILCLRPIVRAAPPR